VAEPLFTVDPQVALILKTLGRMGEGASMATSAVSAQTAVRLQTSMKSRLRRQLSGSSTGLTEAGIERFPDYKGTGWVVASGRAHDRFSWHTMKRSGRSHTQRVTQSNIPLWLEKGASRKYSYFHPRKYFYSAIEEEAGSYLRHLQEALERTIGEAIG